MIGAVVVGLGNRYRRDDGVGPAVAAAVAALRLPGVRVVCCAAETTAILEAWAGAELAVLIDAAAGGAPGRVRRCGLDALAERRVLGSHELNLGQTFELGRVLGRAPGEVVVVTVDVADTGHGPGLSPAVAAALPEAVLTVRGVLDQAHEPRDKQP